MVASEILGGLGEMIGSLAVLAGGAGKSGKQSFKEAVKVWQNLQDPQFDMKSLTAPQLQLIAEYFPETYEAVIPPEVKKINDSPELKAAQMKGIEQMGRIAEQGLPTAEKVMAEQTQKQIQSAATGARSQAIRNLQETGRMSSGMELAAGLSAAGAAGETARAAGSDLVRQAIQNQMAAIEAQNQMATQARGQELQKGTAEAEMINRYNQWTTEAQTEAARNAAEQRNVANLRNISESQRIAEQNQLLNYQTQESNLERQNALRQALANFQLSKTQGLAGAYQGLGNAQYAEQAAKAEQIRGIGRGAGTAVGGVLDIYGGGGGFGTGGFSMENLYKKRV